MTQSATPQAATWSASPGGEPVRLHGRWHHAARFVWVVIAALYGAFFVVSVVAHYHQNSLLASPMREGLAELGLSARAYAKYLLALDLVIAVGFSAVGALIFVRRSDEWMALFVSAMLVMAGLGYGPPADALATQYPAWGPAIRAVQSPGWIALIGVFPFLFPDGRFVPGWTVGIVAFNVGWMGAGTVVNDAAGPAYWPLWVNWLLIAGLLSVCAYAQVYRYRHVSDAVQRQQTRWVVCGFVGFAAILAVGFPFQFLLPTTEGPGWPVAAAHLAYEALGVFASLLIPLSLGVATLRYRLWDLDPIVNRALVYTGLTAGVVALYALVVGSLGAIFTTRAGFLISLVATGVVAVAFQPLRERLQRAVNRLLYGERDDPYTVIARLDQRLEASLAPAAVLPTIVATVREALKLPYVAIELRDGGESALAAEVGSRPERGPAGAPPDGQEGSAVAGDGLLRLSLAYQGDVVGALITASRAPDEPLGEADRRLLADLAAHAGAAVYAVHLTDELQRARERLVTAREEERRRLRRDLHDGLGPQIASQTLTIDAALRVLERDPARAAQLLRELKAQSQDVIADIRRLVYHLRPPALDDLGLVAAIQEQTAPYVHAGLSMRVDAPPALPPLPAAVEVAAYRIVQEALTNVVRHAGARTCQVTLAPSGGWLRVEVRDDGCGLPADHRTGVGLRSMGERAEELGGSLTLEAAAGGGTRVLARLPLQRGDSTDTGRPAE